jgi:hypothetical protein
MSTPIRPALNLVDVADALRQAAANADAVMPPLTAERIAADLLTAASGASVLSWEAVDRWLALAAEINDHAARARRHVEHETFWDGTSPDDATYTAPAETLDDALGEPPAMGVAHRTVTRLYGPWVIDRPTTSSSKETAA